MADDVPAKKAAAKKAPAKMPAANKAAANKAAANKAAAKKTAAKKTAAKKTATKKAAPAAPAVVEAPPAPDSVDGGGPVAPAATVVENLIQLDWKSTLRIAVPTFLALFAAACAVSSTLLLFDNSGDSNVGVTARPGLGDFFKVAAMLASMALDSPVHVHGSDGDGGGSVSLIPLTVTLLVLGVYAALCQRYVQKGNTAETVGRVLRASLVFAGLATVLSAFGRFSEGGTKYSASPAYVFIWGFLLTALVGVAVIFAPEFIQRLRSDERMGERLNSWRLPLEGALVALATAVVLGGVSVIIAAFVEAGHAGQSAGDVARALPLIAGLFVNIGVAVAAMAMGDSVSGSFSGFSSGETEVGYAHLHGASPLYFLLLLLPVVSCLVGIRWMVRRRHDESVRDLSRACYRMAVPFALGWFLLAIPSRLEFGAGVVAAIHVGPKLFLGLVLALGWSGVIGAVVGQLLLRRGELAPSLRPPRSVRIVRLRPSWIQVSVVALVIIAASAVAAVVRHDTAHATAHTAAPVASPPGTATGQDLEAHTSLLAASSAEQAYKSRTGTYSSDPTELGLTDNPDAPLMIVVGTDTRYCMTATGSGTGHVYTYDSDVGAVVSGDRCTPPN
jgi:hypothetical protein